MTPDGKLEVIQVLCWDFINSRIHKLNMSSLKMPFCHKLVTKIYTLFWKFVMTEKHAPQTLCWYMFWSNLKLIHLAPALIIANSWQFIPDLFIYHSAGATVNHLKCFAIYSGFICLFNFKNIHCQCQFRVNICWYTLKSSARAPMSIISNVLQFIPNRPPITLRRLKCI